MSGTQEEASKLLTYNVLGQADERSSKILTYNVLGQADQRASKLVTYLILAPNPAAGQLFLPCGLI